MGPDEKLPVYEAPQIETYTEQEILEELGPAQTQSYNVESNFD